MTILSFISFIRLILAAWYIDRENVDLYIKSLSPDCLKVKPNGITH